MLLVSAVVLVAAGCAHPPARGGGSESDFAGVSQAQGSGHGSSDIEDYRQVLADPGPF